MIHHDGNRRNTLVATFDDDVFVLGNDGYTEVILDFEDGRDRIDISAWDASFDELLIKQLSLTEYVVDYLGEERLRITFETPLEEDIPASGSLLDTDDFIFAPGLPDPEPHVIFDVVTDAVEVHIGTTSPDVFVLTADNARDTLRKFEPGKDVVDIADYGVSFGDLEIIEKKVGRVVVKIDGRPGVDRIVLIDPSHLLEAADVTSDFFLF